MDLLARLRATPSDRGLREVVLDHWLDRGDPRAVWGAALRRGDPQAAARARERLVRSIAGPPPRRVRAIEGFVVEVTWSLEDFVDAPPPGRPLAEHPLAVVRIELPPLVDRPVVGGLTAGLFQAAWTRFVLGCGPVRGVAVGGLQPGHWPTVREWISATAPVVLSLEPDSDPDPPTERWPSVRDVLLRVPAADLAAWLDAVPGADRCALRERSAGDPLVRAWLAVDRPWRAADLRGCDLDPTPPSLAARAASTWIRGSGYEARGLDPLDDPFGDLGDAPAMSTATRHAAVTMDGEDPCWVQSDGALLRWHTLQGWTGTVRTPEPSTALASGPDGAVLGDASGRITLETRAGEAGRRPVAQVPGAVLGLHGDIAFQAVAFRTTEGHGSVADGEVHYVPEPVHHVAMSVHGLVWAVGSVLHLPAGPIDLGDRIHGLTASTHVWVAAGTWVYRVELGARPHVTAARERIDPAPTPMASRGVACAWVGSGGRVVLRSELDGWPPLVELQYPTRYQGGTRRPLQVADLAMGADGELLVALEAGGANVVVGEDVLKLDEQSDEPHLSWVFRHDGEFRMST